MGMQWAVNFYKLYILKIQMKIQNMDQNDNFFEYPFYIFFIFNQFLKSDLLIIIGGYWFIYYYDFSNNNK